MATGKTLTVYLAADVSKLRRGLNDADSSLSGFGKKLSGMVGPALIGAAAAAGAFAVAMAVDGVQAAIQEEAELAKLSKTLDNLGFGAATEQVNSFIDELQYSVAVSDSELRPAYSRLLTATNDVTQSQKLLQLALDVSAGTGRSLDQVTQALSKSMTGNLGALGKLGAGIDSTTIKNKDLDGALAQLSRTFEGQATTAAGTLSGQFKVLGIAFDELKESFGKGFIGGMQEAAGSIDEFTKLLRDSQEMAEDLGQTVGELATEILQLTSDAWQAYKAFDAWTKNDAIGKVAGWIGDVINLGNPFSILRNGLESLTGATDGATNALATNLQGLITWTNTAMQVDKYVRGGYSGIPAKTMFFDIDTWVAKQTALIKPIKQTTTSATGLGKAVEQMNPKLRAQIDLVKDLTKQLDDAGKKLESARKEMNDWIEGMAGQITSGIDLGAAYSMAFDEAGKATGTSLIDAFQNQIKQAGLFGDYLKRLNSEGGPELRDAVAALGPEVGNKLAEEIIKGGLIPHMQSQLVAVKNQARNTAAAMTPEFLVAGVNSAIQFLTGTQNALAAATSQLEEMGKAMGKTIGEAAAKEIADAIAAARGQQASAVSTVAGQGGLAPTTPQAIAQSIYAGSPLLMSTQIAQAIARAISESDQRLGRNVQPVMQ